MGEACRRGILRAALKRPTRTVLSSIAALATALPLFRPGVPLPGATPALAGAPPLDGDARPQTRALRRSLRISVVEGVFAEVVGACAGATVLTAWALHLGAGAPLVGLLTALPFLAHFVQFPAAWLTTRYGHRRVTLLAVGASRQIYLPLAFLPFLSLAPSSQQVIVVALAAAAQVLGVIGNNAWVSWMGDLVPGRIRGRYFGRRTALNTLGGTLAGVGVGLLLDRASGAELTGQFLALLTLLACAVGALTSYLLALKHDPAEGKPREHLPMREAFSALTHPTMRPVLTYQLAWNGAVGLAAGFFTFHMLVNLKMGFALIAAYGAAVALVRLLAAPLWGRVLDRYGAQPVLVVCSFGICVIPLLWLWPTEHFLWPLLLDVLLAGVLWGGHGLAAFALPLSVAPARGRAFYLAAFAACGGVAYALATLVAGALTQVLPEHFVLLHRSFFGLQVLFVLSSLARLGAAFLALRIVEAGAGRPADVLRPWAWRGRAPAAARLRRAG